MKTKVLILGGSGMLGHKMWQVLRDIFATYVTVRPPFSYYQRFNLFDSKHTLDNIEATNPQAIEEAIEKISPAVVINCIGIVKQSQEINNPLKAIEINCLLPHRIATFCNSLDIRSIHISTDCVFSGKKGSYIEEDISDAEDFYGRTKFIGEAAYGKALILRTSVIGYELNSRQGLLEWFLSQEGGKVRGYTKALFSGLTTAVFSEVVLTIIRDYKQLSGLYHISGYPIDKFSLLSLIKKVYGLDVEIEPYDGFICDRSLNSSLFRKTIGFNPPSWQDMVISMHKESEFYNKLKDGQCHLEKT